MRIKNSRGDTIVEVLIAVAIISSVITLSYTTASRALILGRRAQERTEALKLAESTVERIKSFAITDPVTFYDMLDFRLASYCLEPEVNILKLYKQGAVPQEVQEDGLVVAPDTDVEVNDAYNSNCAVGIDDRYKVSLTRRGIDDDQNEFTVRTRWNGLGGAKEEVKIVYRYHRSSTIPELIPPTGECKAGFKLGPEIISPREIVGGLAASDPAYNVGDIPVPTDLGTNNTDTKLYTFATGGQFYSQAVFRGNNKYPSDADGRNAFSFMQGDFYLNYFGTIIDQVSFPGHDLNEDGSLDVPAVETWFYSNGNSIGDPFVGRTNTGPDDPKLEYLLYGREITGLVPGRDYVFYAYMTNALESEAQYDPIISIKVGGRPDDIDGTLLAPPQRLREVDTANNSPNTAWQSSGWVRIGGLFTASGPSVVFKFTDRAQRILGDDFGMTSFGVTECVHT